ncbi:gluconate periplasmic binding protein [Salmonella enterica subsp. enterica]|uniref:Gluconate periplasmic binding protein n=1 Tax=Salmonella enterica I TaxID=59201 RepID=A0A447N2N2_SALET|nr:gluconate periplasmic binding protein [Salmonella enterica subsp. enterica]
MLTVPGLCWLCRMPLALSHWGDLFRMRARRPPARQRVSAMWITRQASFAPLRSLPAKTAALAASGERQ